MATELAAGVVRGDRTAIGRAITLVESTLPTDRAAADQLLTELAPHTGNAHRIGITGVPGVGKSTFIDGFGASLTAAGHRVAVVAVDPSSSRSGGSILGDKTRMARLSVDDAAFIRPAPAGGTLGGVAQATRESMLVLEAAGFDVIVVETVGVGQSETVVHGMVDVFVVLMLAGAGDELQGIKKGVLELADVLAVNKADGDNVAAADQAALDYRRALHLLAPASPHWTPPVLTCSGLTGAGFDELWRTLQQHRTAMHESGEFDQRRTQQRREWMNRLLETRLVQRLLADPAVQAKRDTLAAQVDAGDVTPSVAVEQILAELDR